MAQTPQWRLRHNTAGEPTVRRVVDSEPRLDTGEPCIASDERFEGEPELIGLRAVFGVVNCDVRAARKQQGGIERLGFGFWADAWGNHDLERGRQIHRRQRRLRLVVVRFEDELDVELLGRVVETAQRGNKFSRRCGFLIERDDHRVDREFAVGCRERRATERPHRQHAQEPQRGPRQKNQTKGGFDGDCGDAGRDDRKQRQSCHKEGRRDRTRPLSARGQLRMLDA